MDPYYNPQQFTQYPNSGTVPMPDPSQNFNYLQNSQMMVQQSQSQAMATIQTAQYNFHRDMQSVLQGTMAAGMAVYGTGKTAFDKANERVYQDTLINGGNYVLERSAWRDTMWGLGIAQSDVGRALKIGGRRPEYISGSEYEYQMRRSTKLRQEELGDMLLGGGASVIGMGIGSTLGPPGMLAGMAVGTAVDLTIGKALAPIIDYRKYNREMREFAATTDFSHHAGQTRMSEEAASELADKFYQRDHTYSKYVPLVGGALAKRLGVETKSGETFKKMAQLDLLRDIDPNDVEKIQKQVTKTIEVMDKFAGLMHTTKEAILQMKGKMAQMGFNDTQQNSMLGNLAGFSIGTGFSAQYGMQLGQNFMQAGSQLGYYNVFNPGAQMGYGLSETAAIKAGQEAGLISRNIDAGSLAMMNYSNAANTARTPWGMVTTYGNGNVFNAANTLAQYGNGSVSLGMQLKQTSMYGETKNPLELYEKNLDLTVENLTRGGASKSDAWAYILSRETTREGKDQALETLSGVSDLNKIQAYLGGREKLLQRSGRGAENVTRTYKLSTFKELNEFWDKTDKDHHIQSYSSLFSKGLTNSNLTNNAVANKLSEQNQYNDTLDRISLAQDLGSNTNSSLYETYKNFKDDESLQNAFHMYQGAIGTDKNAEGLRANLVNQIKSKYNKDDAAANQMVDSLLKENETYNGSFRSYVTNLTKNPLSYFGPTSAIALFTTHKNKTFESRLKDTDKVYANVFDYNASYADRAKKHTKVVKGLNDVQYNAYLQHLKSDTKLGSQVTQALINGDQNTALKLLRNSITSEELKGMDVNEDGWGDDIVIKAADDYVAGLTGPNANKAYKELGVLYKNLSQNNPNAVKGINGLRSEADVRKMIGIATAAEKDFATLSTKGSHWLDKTENLSSFKDNLTNSLGGSAQASKIAEKLSSLIQATGFNNENTQNILTKVREMSIGDISKMDDKDVNRMFSGDANMQAILAFTDACNALTKAVVGK